jgi:hypothetical protein
MQTNLTALQEKLINDLKNEFLKLNPQTDNGTVKRFSFESIEKCINEEQQFHDTIKAHNDKIIVVLTKVFNKEITDFKKEFRNSFTVQIGHDKYGNGERNTFEKMVIDNQERINYCNLHASETEIYFVSKTIEQREDRHPCDNMRYARVFLDFDRKKVELILESGKVVSSYQIVGLSYRKYEWLHREKGTAHASLDQYLQMEKSFQNDIVNLIKTN